MNRLIYCLVSLVPVFAQAAPLPIAESSRDTPVDFAKEIYPVFKQNCIACHNASKAKGKLNLESPAAILKGSSSGEVVVPGKPMESLLLIASAHMDEELIMPPEGNKSNAVNLTPEQLALLKQWISEGAKGEAPLAALDPPEWQKLSGRVQPIYATAISPDKRYVACGRGNRIFIYDLATGELGAELTDPALAETTGGAHRDVIQALAFSPQGLLASGGFRTVKPVGVAKDAGAVRCWGEAEVCVGGGGANCSRRRSRQVDETRWQCAGTHLESRCGCGGGRTG